MGSILQQARQVKSSSGSQAKQRNLPLAHSKRKQLKNHKARTPLEASIHHPPPHLIIKNTNWSSDLAQ
jgi:hypothetical protein